jgi:hypothetical protein
VHAAFEMPAKAAMGESSYTYTVCMQQPLVRCPVMSQCTAHHAAIAANAHT